MLVKRNNILSKDIRNVLLIQLGDLGDVILSFPSIRALRENFPQANVVVAVREKARELIDDCTWATGVISVNKDKKGLKRELAYQKEFYSRLRKFHFDLAIDMRTGTRGAILAFLSGARQRIGFYSHEGVLWRNRLFTRLAYLEGKEGQHMAEYYLSLLFAYDLKTQNIWPELDVPERKRQNAEALFKRERVSIARPMIAIQPFSRWQYKEWGTHKYIQLINRISSEYEPSVILMGSPEESRRIDEITQVCHGNVYNFAGKTSIGMLAAVLNACGLCIGGDSAGIHFAAALGTPTVSIFGPSSASAWAPRGKKHCVVQKNLPCVPCNLKGCQSSGFSRCLEELTVDEVSEVVNRQIEKILND
jgi:heptosyltransferase-3